jgi:hypothetical protein
MPKKPGVPPTPKKPKPPTDAKLRVVLKAMLRARATNGECSGTLVEGDPCEFRFGDVSVRAFIRRHYNGSMVREGGDRLLVLTTTVTRVPRDRQVIQRALEEGSRYPFTSVCLVATPLDERVAGELVVYSTLLAEEVTDRALDHALRALAQRYYELPLELGDPRIDPDMRRERRRAAARREARDAERPSVPGKGTFFSIKVNDEVSPEELARRTIEEIGIEYESQFTTPPPKGANAGSGPTGADVPCRNDAELAEAMADLDRLVGLKEVKEQIRGLVDLYRYNIARRNVGYRVQNFAPHLVFVGNPGTGKTTVARLIGRIYRALGLLKTGDVVDADRSRLVAGYTGQTAILTRKMCDLARGGILFIDEAYSLLEDRYSFGSEAVATLLVEMERLRGELVVIVAGYPKQMDAFIASNPGLRSRFDRRITFADYSTDELTDIFVSEVRAHDMELAPEARTLLRDRLDAWPRDGHFGNGRDVRRLVETVMVAQARHWGESSADTTALSTITAAAVEAAFGSTGKDLATTPTSHRIGYL